jgi:hypothetical protein
MSAFGGIADIAACLLCPQKRTFFTHPTAALNPSRLVAREQCGAEPVSKYAAVKRGPGSMPPSPPRNS